MWDFRDDVRDTHTCRKCNCVLAYVHEIIPTHTGISGSGKPKAGTRGSESSRGIFQTLHFKGSQSGNPARSRQALVGHRLLSVFLPVPFFLLSVPIDSKSIKPLSTERSLSFNSTHQNQTNHIHPSWYTSLGYRPSRFEYRTRLETTKPPSPVLFVTETKRIERGAFSSSSSSSSCSCSFEHHFTERDTHTHTHTQEQ